MCSPHLIFNTNFTTRRRLLFPPMKIRCHIEKSICGGHQNCWETPPSTPNAHAGMHCSEVIWALRCFISLAIRLFVQQVAQVYKKENTKDCSTACPGLQERKHPKICINGPFVRGIHQSQMVFPHKHVSAWCQYPVTCVFEMGYPLAHS